MKFMVRRPLGDWLTRDLELGEVERTRSLSGPSTISAKIDGALARRIMSDGRPLIDDWNTHIYAVSESTGRIENNGIVIPPTSYDDKTSIVCGGYSAYPKGLIYRHAKFWGPQQASEAKDVLYDDDGTTVLQEATPAVPGIDRPYTIDLYRELWEYTQATYSDLGVTLIGNKSGGVQTGTFAEPYRLQYWDSPDLGSEMEKLAEATPFDFVEDPRWMDPGAAPAGDPIDRYGEELWPPGYGSSQTSVRHYIRVGDPRLGKKRTDLRFMEGENVVLPPPVSTFEGANMVLGIGNGDPGPNMAQAFTAIEDGRLKRIAYVTDKTLDQAGITALTNATLRRLQQRPIIESLAIVDHPGARLSSIQLGDDIFIQGTHPQYGTLDVWVRVLAITQGASETTAVLSVRDSTQFTYPERKRFQDHDAGTPR